MIKERSFCNFLLPAGLVPIFLLLLFISTGYAAPETAPEGMALIPGGEFAAGLNPDRGFEECKKYRDGCKKEWYKRESPVHTVLLDAFYMDKYEVTQKKFQQAFPPPPHLGVGFLGVPFTLAESWGLEASEGILVVRVKPDSLASAAGLRINDVIIKYDNQDIRAGEALTKLVMATPLGKTVKIDLVRGGKRARLSVTITPPILDSGLGKLPAQGMTWHQAKEFCAQVDKRLPTEAEWEKAAKAGTDTLYFWGNQAESDKANFCDINCEFDWRSKQLDDGYRKAGPVGSFSPNGYGLHDMAGNVWEWVADWYSPDYYAEAPRHNPKGPSDGENKVMRGGSWVNTPIFTRSAYRSKLGPSQRSHMVGFRCVADPPPGS